MTAFVSAERSKYQVMPPLTAEEYAALREDIRANGVRVPVDVDENGEILDGHHRAQAADELGVDYPRRLVAGLTEAQKLQYAFAVNVHRRSLTREQRREVLARSLLAEPEASDREHARRVGTSHMTVAAVREELESTGQVVQSPVRLSGDGRLRPATQPPRPPVDPEPPPDPVREFPELVGLPDAEAHRVAADLRSIPAGPERERRRAAAATWKAVVENRAPVTPDPCAAADTVVDAVAAMNRAIRDAGGADAFNAAAAHGDVITAQMWQAEIDDAAALLASLSVPKPLRRLK